jgi:hypothetical protein
MAWQMFAAAAALGIVALLIELRLKRDPIAELAKDFPCLRLSRDSTGIAIRLDCHSLDSTMKARLVERLATSRLKNVELTLAGADDDFFRALTSRLRIERLSLVDSSIRSESLAAALDADRMEALSASACRWTDEHVRVVGNHWRELVELDLSDNAITNAGILALCGCPKLVDLDLSQTKITDVGLIELRRIPTLSSLGLDGTRVSADGLRCLAGHPRLNRISIDSTAVTPEDRTEIREAFAKSGRTLEL